MNAKPWYASQTILGLIATALATAVQTSGRAWAPEDIQAVVQGVALAGQATGLLWAAWGRWRASGPLTVGKTPGAGAAAGCLLLALGLLAGCASAPMTVNTPVLIPDAQGQLAPVPDGKGGYLMQVATVPSNAIPYYVQGELAKQRRPYVEQTFDGQGKLTGQKIWGENGRPEMREVDSDNVKIVRAVSGPGGAVAVAGLSGYFGVLRDHEQWSGLAAIMSGGSKTPTTVTVSGGSSYNTGNVGQGGSWQFNPSTSTWDNHATEAQ